jgi:nitrite reductase/ring-hydroxylating ferredoxin subunit
VYAFQEFCTHRYGPLSEGKLQDRQVICPWHRSCFDIRTGRVLEGPAKVDLKTYSATIRGGKIFIK